MAYYFLKLVGIFIFKVLFRVKVTGMENIPKEGRVILAPRHCSYFDPMALFHICPRIIHPVVGKAIYNLWWLNWVFRASFCISSNGSSNGAIAMLEKDEAILIFPEGKLEKDGHIIKARGGVAVFAIKTGAPVVPVWIHGTYEAWSVKSKAPKLFRSLEVNFGKPLAFPKRDEDIIPPEIIKETLDKIMKAIIALSGKVKNS